MLKLADKIEYIPFWFPPERVTFSRFQMTNFLLPHLDLLEMGDYPREPEQYRTLNEVGEVIKKERSSYAGPEFHTPSWRKHGKHEMACMIGAEIRYRLDRCPHGWIVPLLADGYEEPLELARRCRLTEDQMKKEYRLMLDYICGWRRKLCTFHEWKLIDRIFRGLIFN